MLSVLVFTLLADYDAPKGDLTDGDLGVIELVKADEKRATVRVRIPRAWRTKAGTKITFKGPVRLADDRGVLFTGPAPVFTVEANCENDGGTWSEPVATLELKLTRPLRKPVSSQRIIGLVMMGKTKLPPITFPPVKTTQFRADLDGDGKLDTELRENDDPSQPGCGSALEENDFNLVTATGGKFSAMCCGP